MKDESYRLPVNAKVLAHQIASDGIHAHRFVTNRDGFGWRMMFQRSKKCGTDQCLWRDALGNARGRDDCDVSSM